MERRKWTIWTSLSIIAIVAAVALGATLYHTDVASASKTVWLRNSIAGTGCEDLGEYLFIMTQTGPSGPAFITVYLSGGGSIQVANSKQNNNNAHYSLAEGDVPAGQVPVNASAVVPDDYRGNLVISHVPCPSPSPSPSPSPTPEPSPSPEPSPEPSPAPSPGL